MQTARALDNFQITGIPLSHFPNFVRALAMVKKAAARANRKLGLLPERLEAAMAAACDEVIAGQWHDQFVVDMIQGGAGTSTNMNANEVIANRALELLGYEKGQYEHLHPNNHVNLSQSTNDVYPTAIRLGLLLSYGDLTQAMEDLCAALRAKGEEFAHIIKMGRTQLQDAVPMTLGQEFRAFATTMSEDIERTHELVRLLREVNLGATAIGTGINTDPDYAPLVVSELSEISGESLVLACGPHRSHLGYRRLRHLFGRPEAHRGEGIQDLQRSAPPLQRPACGIGGNQSAAGAAGFFHHAGQGQSGDSGGGQPGGLSGHRQRSDGNVCGGGGAAAAQCFRAGDRSQHSPVHPHHDPCHDALTERCIKGITANEDHCRKLVTHSIGLVTALNPVIGYQNATRIAQKAQATGRGVADLVLEEGCSARSNSTTFFGRKT